MEAKSWPYPRLIAHRCGGVLAPENTLAGLRVAALHGVRGVEFDVMLSADGTPVLIHDETWERTTDGKGRVSETRDEAIARLDAGSSYSPEFAGEPVPTLEAAARLCRRLGLAANVEIKPAAGHDEATGRVVAEAVAGLWRGATLFPLLASFSDTALAAAYDAAPGLSRGLLVKAVSSDWHRRMTHARCGSLHCDAHANSLTRIREIIAEGVPLVCYTVNRPDRAQALLAAGVASVITDRIDLMSSGSAN